MMWNEFCKLAKQEVSYDDYINIIEPMYMATKMSKEEFIDFIKPSTKVLEKKYKEANAGEPEYVLVEISKEQHFKVAQVVDYDVSISKGKSIYKLKEISDAEVHKMKEEGVHLADFERLYDDDPSIIIKWV